MRTMNILLVQVSYVGDSVLSTPVISGIRQLFPDARLTLMTTPGSYPLFKLDPRIDELIVFDKRGSEKGIKGMLNKAGALKAKQFDRVYSLHRSYRTAVLLFLARIPERIGFSDASLKFLYSRRSERIMDRHAVISNLSLLFGDDMESRFEKKLKLHAPAFEALNPDTRELIHGLSDRYAVISPGSVWATKIWHVQGFIETAKFLSERGFNIVLTGSPDDRDLCRKISDQVETVDLSGRIPISDTMYIIKHSRLVVCNDSMALHMGSAFQTPTVAVFCATSPSTGFGPWENPKARVVQDDTLPCKPCGRHGSMKCPNGTEACMTVPAEQVVEAITDVLELKP
ncbi:MAG: glycosyltransferase family 9 protein [Desulfobacteraceae bacterium]|nr:MAG: glycosyltransferase family 9 protein [Desulfobacteraceae bacterium]